MEDETEDCGSCKYFAYYSSCARHAPVTGIVDGKFTERFPYTTENDWCGDYKRLSNLKEKRPWLKRFDGKKLKTL